VELAQRATHKTTEADIHKHYTTEKNIEKQAQGKTLIPFTALGSGAVLAMPEADPAGLHKEDADTALIVL
jgi:hypothetical protein